LNTAAPDSMTDFCSLFNPTIVDKPGYVTHWGRLYGSAYGLAIYNAANQSQRPWVVITPDTRTAVRLEYELRFYGADSDQLPLMHFPDWETLPYDTFSPHQDIISDRLTTLHRLPGLQRGILVLPISTVMQRLAPAEFIDANSLLLELGQQLDMDIMRKRLVKSSYRLVSQVMEHGEFAVRGSIIDIFPMGSRVPYRIELFDNEVETIRSFDAESQRSIESVEQIHLLPAREFPLTEQSIAHFRQMHRAAFSGDPNSSSIYRDVSNGIAPTGIEYYLPLFFDKTATLFDYLPDNCVLCMVNDAKQAAEHVWEEIEHRFEQRRHDIQRPILPPGDVFLTTDELNQNYNRYPQIDLQSFKQQERSGAINFDSEMPPVVNIDARSQQPIEKLSRFVDTFEGRILFTAESTGRRETLVELLNQHNIRLTPTSDWRTFLNSSTTLAVTIAPLEHGLLLSDNSITVIAEAQVFGEQVLQQRRRKAKQRDPELIIKNLVELEHGSPVVHEEHGVGRYLGLQILNISGIDQEFLALEYADKDKLYVPVASLHLISRYSGASPESAPLHKLGSSQWEKAKRKAREHIVDTAITSNRIRFVVFQAHFHSRKLRISWMLSRASLTICGPTNPWTDWYAVMSDLEKPRSPCARHSLRCKTANKLLCWFQLHF